MQLTDDQQMIADSAKAFLADACSPAVLQTWKPDQTRADDATWARIRTELGWPATLISEAHGGLGLGMSEMCLILESSGASLLNAPLWSGSVWTTLLLQRAIQPSTAAALLERMAAGVLTVVAALPQDGFAFDVATLPQRGRAGNATTPNPVAQPATHAHWNLVADATSADHLVLPVATATGQLSWVLADAAQCRIEPIQTWDLSRPFARVSMSLETLQSLPLVGREDANAVLKGTQDALDLAALGLAAELSGGIARCLQVTLDYAKERVQFGRVIAGFQAVKHRCAQIMVEQETVRSALSGALSGLSSSGEGLASPLSDDQIADIASVVSLAKDAAFFAAQEAIQLHGGVGFTWEYEPHFHFKRAQSLSSLLGTADQWRERIAAHILD